MSSSIIPLPDGGKIVKTNCFECHSKCGVLCTVDKDDKLIKVQGNPEDPRNEGRMCAKGLSAPEILYDPDRLRYPLLRVGERGEGKWKRISWDEAIKWLADKVKAITAEHGAKAIAYGQGTGRGTNQWTQLGGFMGGEVGHSLSPGNICLVPMMVQGFMQFGMFPTFDGVDFDNADCIVFWGSNTVWTEGSYSSGQVGRSRDRGAKLIVIDPFFEHPLASKADVFVPVRPSSDVYMALAWLNIIINEDLYDHEFTTKYSNAPLLITVEDELPVTLDMLEDAEPNVFLVWDKATQSVKNIHDKDLDQDIWYRGELTLKDGKKVEVKTAFWALKELADEWSPAKAAEMCWCEPQQIIDSCRIYANAEAATISVFQGIEEHTNCKETLHLINIIISITGNLEKKGGNLSMPFWQQMRGLAGKPPETQAALRMYEDGPEGAKGTLYGTASLPKAAFAAMRTGKPYPIKAYICVQGNPLSWAENTKKVRESLMSLDVLCMMDYYMSPTCELADLVLPAAHWTERDYIGDEVCSEWVFGQQKAVEPLYERWSDITFWRTYGREINKEAWPWETDEELFDYQLKETNAGVTWKELKGKWIHHLPPFSSREYWKNGFPTPTGRAELYSIGNLRAGAFPLPRAEEAKETPYSKPEMAAEYPLIAVTGRRYPIYYHSSFRGIPHLRELAPHPMVVISTALAKKQNIQDGDEVYIETVTGKISMQARSSDGLHERMIMIPHGWWQGCPELNLPAYPDDSANVNVLTGDKAYSNEFMTPNMRSVLCKIYKK
ncbi:MAG TPA: molybdopterin-dependent oxidoreductase [Syntrophomonadaceae bacterium]|nr:molybdopterin-dependent oxidoreductase [Syntrophomonadaceae bacterium]